VASTKEGRQKIKEEKKKKPIKIKACGTIS